MQPTRRQLLGASAAAAIGAVTRQSHAAAVPPAKYGIPGEIKPGFQLSLAAYSLRQYLPQDGKKGKFTLHDLLDYAAIWGLTALEPTSYYFDSEDIAYVHSLKAKAFKLGIDISGTSIRNDFCLPPGAERDAQLAHVKKWVDIALALGAPCIRIFAGKAKGGEREQDFARAAEAMKTACDYAGTKGIFLAIENHGYLTETAADVLRFIDTVKHEWLGLNLDTGNFVRDPYENIALAAPKAITVQVKEEVVAPGSPDPKKRVAADWPKIIEILRKARYRGYVALEYEGKKDPLVAVPRDLEKLRRIIAG